MPSKIEWTTDTWNPTTGCDKVSPGCGLPRFEGDDTGGCYALGMARRLKAMGQAKYQADGDPRTSGPGFGVAMHPDSLTIPLHWRKPRLVFVNSMSDLGHARITREFLARVWAVMAATPQHTYQTLSKRPDRMRRLLSSVEFQADVWRELDRLAGEHQITEPPGGWPLRNVWVGTSVELDRYCSRADDLRETPAAVRFLSCEPLLGPLPSLSLDGIGWLIAGGESGPDARPMLPAWPRTLRDQCQAASVPFFFKQWGEWAPTGAVGIGGHDPRRGFVGAPVDEHGCREEIARVGKHNAGRVLDGRTWDEYPVVGWAAA
jgi:protein gp37